MNVGYSDTHEWVKNVEFLDNIPSGSVVKFCRSRLLFKQDDFMQCFAVKPGATAVYLGYTTEDAACWVRLHFLYQQQRWQHRVSIENVKTIFEVL